MKSEYLGLTYLHMYLELDNIIPKGCDLWPRKTDEVVNLATFATQELCNAELQASLIIFEKRIQIKVENSLTYNDKFFAAFAKIKVGFCF